MNFYDQLAADYHLIFPDWKNSGPLDLKSYSILRDLPGLGH